MKSYIVLIAFVVTATNECLSQYPLKKGCEILNIVLENEVVIKNFKLASLKKKFFKICIVDTFGVFPLCSITIENTIFVISREYPSNIIVSRNTGEEYKDMVIIFRVDTYLLKKVIYFWQPSSNAAVTLEIRRFKSNSIKILSSGIF